MDTGRIVTELKRERDRLSKAITALEGQSPRAIVRMSVAPNVAAGSNKKRDHLSAAGRKRLSELMKKRWAEKRKKGSTKRQ